MAFFNLSKTLADSGADRRKEQRYEVFLEAKLNAMSAFGVLTHVTNLNLNGCFINTPLVVKPGEMVQIHFILPSGRYFAISGRVCFYKRDGLGVKFNLVGNQHELLMALIEFARDDV